MEPNRKKPILTRGRAFVLLLAALLLFKPLLTWIGDLSLKYQFGGWYPMIFPLFVAAYLFLLYSLGQIVLGFVHSVAGDISEKRRQTKMNAPGVEREWAVITEIKEANYTINDERPAYLCYRLGDQVLETRLTNYALQDAVGKRIPVYRQPDGTVYVDQDGVEFSSSGAPERGESTEQKSEWTVSLGEQEVTIRDQSATEETAKALLSNDPPQREAPREVEAEKPKMVPAPGLKQETANEPKKPEDRIHFSWSIASIGLIFLFLALLALLVILNMSRPGAAYLIFFVLLGLGIWPIAWACWDYGRQKDVFLHGRTLRAKVTEVVRGNVNNNGLASYTVRCRAGERSFETRTISPPADAVGKTVTVMVSKTNPKHYEILLDTVRS